VPDEVIQGRDTAAAHPRCRRSFAGSLLMSMIGAS
jgi:hypothetical protein